jgi:hypothetical protein
MRTSATCPGCRQYPVTVTPTGALRAHDSGNGIPCPGKGFRLDQPIYPQLIKLWGWETGQKLMKQEFPEWVSPMDSGPHPIGTLQKLVLKAYPSADAFGYTSGRGITFCVSKRWYFATPDGHVGEKYPTRVAAADAADEYLKEK